MVNKYYIDPKLMKKALKRFHKKLLEDQEPLDPKIQKVIDDNFWDLLVKEENTKGE